MSSTPVAPDRSSVCAQSPTPVQAAAGTQTEGEKPDVTKTRVVPGIQFPEGHDRDYHLKKADGSPDYHIPMIKSLLARPDVSLHEAFVYGLLLDKLGPGHTYCCPTQAEIAKLFRRPEKVALDRQAHGTADGHDFVETDVAQFLFVPVDQPEHLNVITLS